MTTTTAKTGQEENTNITRTYTLHAVSLTFAKCHSYDCEDHERFRHEDLYANIRKCKITCCRRERGKLASVTIPSCWNWCNGAVVWSWDSSAAVSIAVSFVGWILHTAALSTLPPTVQQRKFGTGSTASWVNIIIKLMIYPIQKGPHASYRLRP